MDVSNFAADFPGTLARIAGGDHAFIPDLLPPQWEFPVRLWPLLAETKQQIGVLEGLGRNLPNPAILLRPLGDREAIRSSSLEGTYASPRELLLFELEPKESKSEDDPANDQREVFNYRKALHHGAASELPISLRLIRELHEILLTGVRGRDRAPGKFRRIQVAIGATSRFVPPPPDRVTECLDRLEKYVHSTTRFDPLVDAFLIHYQFEAIHPFVDGNGRVGRLLLAIMLQQRCRLSKPWLYLSEFFDRHREEYIRRLFEISTRGDWTGWVEFCLTGTLQQTSETIQRCERLLAIRKEFLARLAKVGGSVRLHEIVEQIFHSPFVRVKDMPERFGVTYPTAKADIDRLVKAKILKSLPNVAVKTYYAPQVFEIAYEEMKD